MATVSLFPSILLLHPSSPARICFQFQSTSLKNPLFNSKTPNLLVIRAQNTNPWSPSSSVVTDETVPEGHTGLHGLLYGDKGAQVHDHDDQNSPQNSARPILGEDDGSSIIPIKDYLNSNSRQSFKFGGVYAIYNSEIKIQFVGYSRNVVLSLKSHMDRVGNSLCCSVRVKMMFTDSSIVSRQSLEQEMQEWMQQYGVPPGNSDPSQRELWEGGLKVSAMSPEERNAYHDKKFKLRKAMGENLYDDDEDDDDEMRKVKLLNATEGDDWSAVIDGQTKETLHHPQSSSIDDSDVSPFRGQGTSGLYSAAIYNLTVENVDMVLNDVRPYLIADGGNVEVAGVEDGVISLRLQGACGSCPSSTTTMKMGIERVLKEKFGDALKEIRQVDQQDIGATVASVNSHLDMLRPAIQNYGGSVEVLSVEGGDCHVKYNGPGSIGMGIQAAIKDKFPDITNVVLINP